MFVAPTTELVFLAPKDGVTLDELRGVLTLARERLSALPEDIALDGVLGEAEERPNQLLLLVGWESLEASAILCKALTIRAPLIIYGFRRISNTSRLVVL